MREIVVPGIGIKIPVIGFGCSSLTGTGRKNAVRLLETAFGAGVRHFDVARYYGYGETERILATLVRSHRSQITITTKFGIQPRRRTNALRIALRMGRRFVRLMPSARTFVQRRTKILATTGAFGVDDARQSLETSLRELGTDYIDFFLLHDYVIGDHLPDELLRFLEGAVTAGQIRYFGIGTDIDNVLRALKCQPALCDVTQFENSVLRQNTKRWLQGAPSQLVVTHGSLGASYRSVLSFLKTNRKTVKRWSASLDVDCSRKDILAALMLNYAVEANPNGLVLFSSKNSERVTKNVEAVLESSLSIKQVALFAQLVEQESVPLTP
ncbi:MAG: aldo/keto reductase [Candidatus Acidiferrales bacterium]